MEEALDFSEVAEDTEFVTSATRLEECLARLEDHMQRYPQDLTLSIEEQLDHELYSLFTLNTLFWMKLKLQGIDPATHPVKAHLAHVRQLMERKKEIIDRRTRPTLNKNVAARFIRNGLWQPKQNEPHPPNKKIKFAD